MEKNDEYQVTDERLFERLRARIGDNLRFYCATGSYGRGDILPGWSDIDILIVLRNYDLRAFDEIGRAASEIGSPIKIGITLFSTAEFADPSPKSSRTYLAINAILAGKYKPRLCEPEINLISVPIETIRAANRTEFARVFHDLKRELLRLESCDERKVCKFITIILKIFLQERDITADGYESVSDNMPMFDHLAINFPKPKEIMESPERKSERFPLYIDFVEKIGLNASALFSDRDQGART